mmetsp:Transcript_45260/g.105617  ORF Transcript_45260/g.105617 Transcript_45260/m.105617 type:complete len:1013 (-) Transcript_45260:29-3067(-)
MAALPSQDAAASKFRKLSPADKEVELASERLEISSLAARLELSLGLPPDWLVCRTDEGEVYYHKPSTGVSQWSHPGRDWQKGHAERLAKALNHPELPKIETEAKEDLEAALPTEGAAAEPPQHSVYDASSRHVELDTPGSLFSDAVDIQREDLVGRAFALRGLLSAAEAASFTRSLRRVGFGQSDVAREFPSSLRNNSRLIHFSEALASALYRRLAPHLAHRDIYLAQPMGFGAEGRWKPVGVNPCFRMAQYKEGEHFASHCDGMYANDHDECSIYSLVLYLNEDYEGGGLDFTDTACCFRPSAGCAVLLPHDLPHSAGEVYAGTKYVARSELMFRCIDRRRPPAVPKYAADPLFQRMASLYEHIGDLVQLGDAEATTKAYQEALKIQIDYQGTTAKATSWQALPLEDKSLEHALSYLAPGEVCGASSVSRKWQSVSMAGSLWRAFCHLRWPDADEIVEGRAYQLDAELRDWFGLFRQKHVLEGRAPTCVVFMSATIQCWAAGAKTVPAVAASLSHQLTGIGWDSSFKQRVGWEIGLNRWGGQRGSWIKDHEVNFQLLSEAFAWTFAKLQIRPNDHHLVVPLLPGIFERRSKERLTQILARRFQVPQLSFVDAPLCALRAHGLSTGAVIWGETCRCVVSFYLDGEEVAEIEEFAMNDDAASLASLLFSWASRTRPEIRDKVLQHVVLSSQPRPVESDAPRKRGEGVTRAPPAWENVAKLLDGLEQKGLDCQTMIIHEPLESDVIIGAQAMAQELPHVTAPIQTDAWEWRVEDADEQWLPFPEYIAGVFEGALRADKKFACVQLDTNDRWFEARYLVADLENFQVALARPHLMCRGHVESLEYVHVEGPWRRMTRFMRGRPQASPDLRKPEDVEREQHILEDVKEVEGPAVHVRNMAGKLIFSASACDAADMTLPDLMRQLGGRLLVDPIRLKVLDGAEELEQPRDLSRRVGEREVVDLQVLVGPPPKPKRTAGEHCEQIPEDLPGEARSPSVVSFLKALSQDRRKGGKGRGR